MKRIALLFFVVSVACIFAVVGASAKETSKGSPGEKLFMKHCGKCHPNGGNVVTVTKTLDPREREANKVTTEEDIVRLMRNPGPGMVKFGKNVISEKDAKAIAKYILETFK